MEQSERLIWKDSKRKQKSKIRGGSRIRFRVFVLDVLRSPEYGVRPSMLYVVVLRMYSVDSQGQIEPIFHVLAKKKKHAPSGVRPVQVLL